MGPGPGFEPGITGSTGRHVTATPPGPQWYSARDIITSFINSLHYITKSRRGDIMGRVKKGQVCLIEGCSEPAIRAISWDEIVKAGADTSFKFKETSLGKIYLCKKHYKEVKKLLKKSKRLEKWRWMAST